MSVLNSVNLIFFLSTNLFLVTQQVTFTILNKCNDVVWPAVLTESAGLEPPFSLKSGESKTYSAPPYWSGKIWGRTLCAGDTSTFSCLTGDCGSSATSQCSSTPAATTVAEFGLKSGSTGLDFYHVTLMYGFNLPMAALPRGGSTGGGGNCTESGCFADLNEGCPAELRRSDGGGTVGCRSVCEVYGQPYECCTAAGATTSGCEVANSHSGFFTSQCLLAMITFSCASNDYVVTFCPSSSKAKSPSTSQVSSNESSNGEETKTHNNKSNTNHVAAIIVPVFICIGVIVIIVYFLRKGKINVCERFNPNQCSCSCPASCISINLCS